MCDEERPRWRERHDPHRSFDRRHSRARTRMFLGRPRPSRFAVQKTVKLFLKTFAASLERLTTELAELRNCGMGGRSAISVCRALVASTPQSVARALRSVDESGRTQTLSSGIRRGPRRTTSVVQCRLWPVSLPPPQPSSEGQLWGRQGGGESANALEGELCAGGAGAGSPCAGRGQLETKTSARVTARPARKGTGSERQGRDPRDTHGSVALGPAMRSRAVDSAAWRFTTRRSTRAGSISPKTRSAFSRPGVSTAGSNTARSPAEKSPHGSTSETRRESR